MNLTSQFVAFLMCAVFSIWAQPVGARPSKELKEQRRSAFWGVFSDMYRASGCLGFQPTDFRCAQEALGAALGHAVIVDQLTTEQNLQFAEQVRTILRHLDSRDLEASRSTLNVFLAKLFKDFAEDSTPAVQPDRVLGQSLYQQYCGSCHGDGRLKTGSLASKLKRTPPSFDRQGRFSTQFPFGIYAVMIHGTDDGEMPAFIDVLSIDELWAIAFYVTSLPHEGSTALNDQAIGDKIQFHSEIFALSALAMATDEGLMTILKEQGVECGSCLGELSYLRVEAPSLPTTRRLTAEAKAPRVRSGFRALVTLLVMIVGVSAGFVFILKRTGRTDGDL
jgi:mono/diheme cytochrome c family protein